MADPAHISDPESAETNPFNISEDFVPSRTHKAAGILTVDFDGLLDPPLRLQEDLKEGNGGQAWPAGMVLAKYLLRHQRKDIEGRSMIELGAGGGLVGLALTLALKHNPSTQIHITDLPQMLPLMQQNIALNFSSQSPSITPAVYSWGSPPPSNLPVPPDVILAADCVYFEPAFPLLQSTLSDLLGSNTVCWFCFKRRRRADMGFARELRKRFEVAEVGADDVDGAEVKREADEWRRENIHLYRITRKTINDAKQTMHETQ
ncbi:hypothetical protein NA57DRAFT_82390 [Rhizodiscina lignyota]|uniref:Protein-lysine N-methyltransferase EFM6 n=1 Tax=Rhizodiscina lignyota TaxID=1504668 RepID=A0A9P4HZW0_9PEZI|nr:hypothetical protein NA57DRAFT_82390 [Rhizodiscina lignyota]